MAKAKKENEAGAAKNMRKRIGEYHFEVVRILPIESEDDHDNHQFFIVISSDFLSGPCEASVFVHDSCSLYQENEQPTDMANALLDTINIVSDEKNVSVKIGAIPIFKLKPLPNGSYNCIGGGSTSSNNIENH